MGMLEEVLKCDLCGKSGKDLSRLSANHKELGRIMICRECWTNLYDENRMVCSGTGGSGKNSCSTCGL